MLGDRRPNSPSMSLFERKVRISGAVWISIAISTKGEEMMAMASAAADKATFFVSVMGLCFFRLRQQGERCPRDFSSGISGHQCCRLLILFESFDQHPYYIHS